MARIAGVDLPRNKRIEISLTYIYGIGRTLAKEIGGTAAMHTRAKQLGLTNGFIKQCRLSGTQAALRVCMNCSAHFLSWGSQNRLCRRCVPR